MLPRRHSRSPHRAPAHVDSFHGTLRIVDGDRVWEVMPPENRGKGAAACHAWWLHAPDALPVYIGNDGTDESAFRELARGITIRVGPARLSRAHFRLRNPADVRRFLELLGGWTAAYS